MLKTISTLITCSMILVLASCGSRPDSAKGTIPPPANYIPDDGTAQLLDLTNAYRKKKRRPQLILDHRLILAAKEHSDAMAEHNFFAHIGEHGTHFQQRMAKQGYPLSHSAENLAKAPSAEIVFNMWRDSTGHRKNMINKKYRRIGIYRTADYWTAIYAAPDGT